MRIECNSFCRGGELCHGETRVNRVGVIMPEMHGLELVGHGFHKGTWERRRRIVQGEPRSISGRTHQPLIPLAWHSPAVATTAARTPSNTDHNEQVGTNASRNAVMPVGRHLVRGTCISRRRLKRIVPTNDPEQQYESFVFPHATPHLSHYIFVARTILEDQYIRTRCSIKRAQTVSNTDPSAHAG